MNHILKAISMGAILAFFVGCKPVDKLNDYSFELQVIPLNTINNEVLSVVNGVVCDGVSSVELRLEHKSILVPTDVRIEAEAKFGTFTTGPAHFDRTSIIYTAPAMFPGGYGQSAVNFPITIQVSVGSQKVYYNTAFKLIRIPVLMAHDMASNATAFSLVRDELISCGNYSGLSLRVIDYAATSMSSYQTNQSVISDGIDSLRRQCLRGGYLASKVDVVSHGTGGVLSRIYMQSQGYRYDISKFITIDSPHYGSQLANFGIEFGKANEGTILSLITHSGALSDMQVGSAATQDLNSAKFNKIKVPTHVISSTSTGNNHVKELIDQKQYITAMVSYLVDELTEEPLFEQRNDIFVPLSSQNSGLSGQYTTNYDNQWHYSILSYPGLGVNITDLLASNTNSVDSPFTLDGFKLSTLTYTAPGAKVTNFIESAPVTSIQRNQTVRVEFHTPQSVASSIFVITYAGADGVDKIYYMDNTGASSTTYSWTAPNDAPNALKFHLLARSSDSSLGDIVYYNTSYNVQINN